MLSTLGMGLDYPSLVPALTDYSSDFYSTTRTTAIPPTFFDEFSSSGSVTRPMWHRIPIVSAISMYPIATLAALRVLSLLGGSLVSYTQFAINADDDIVEATGSGDFLFV